MAVKTKKRCSKTKEKISPEERALRKKQHDLKKNIRSIFLNMGFKSLPVKDKEFKVGERLKNEIDHCYIFENLIIIVEDTITTRNVTDHIRNKMISSKQILDNKAEFLFFLQQFDSFDRNEYDEARWIVKYLYISDYEYELNELDKKLYNPMIFVKPDTLKYFVSMSQILKKSFKYEFFRFLNIKRTDIGNINQPQITMPKVPILYPTGITGLNNGVQVISFMMSAEQLIKNGYVLRKDNWEESAFLYQRLITKNRIDKIRDFVSQNSRTFFNNIIVSLPPETEIYDGKGNKINPKMISDIQNCKMQLPDEFNTIGIIDGQHRIYAYYEDNNNNKLENKIKQLRSKIYLLVTGLLFPADWDSDKRGSFEANVFKEINENSKNVKKDVLLHIEKIQNPYSRNSISRAILEKLNETSIFKNKFQLSDVKKAQIKIPSIIEFALSKLVEPDKKANGLYYYWSQCDINTPDVLTIDSENAKTYLNNYIDFCVEKLHIYFSAIHYVYKEKWEEKNNKILKTFAINSFIITFNKSLLLTDGIKDFEYYKNIFKKKTFDFNNIGYAGSQYNLFANEVLIKLFE